MDPLVRGMLHGMVKSIKVESNAFEAFTLDEPFAEGDGKPGKADAALKALKPKLVIEVRDGEPLVIAPYGEPDPELRSKVKMGTGLVGGLAGVGLLAWLIGRKRR